MDTSLYSYLLGIGLPPEVLTSIMGQPQQPQGLPGNMQNAQPQMQAGAQQPQMNPYAVPAWMQPKQKQSGGGGGGGGGGGMMGGGGIGGMFGGMMGGGGGGGMGGGATMV
jgi:hypothetical protein